MDPPRNTVGFLPRIGDPHVVNLYLTGYTMFGQERESLAHIIRDKKRMLNRVRRIKGQVESIESAIDRGAECSDILHTISACRGAINALMAEVIDGHIRFHVMDPNQNPRSEKARATQELIDVIRTYLR